MRHQLSRRRAGRLMPFGNDRIQSQVRHVAPQACKKSGNTYLSTTVCIMLDLWSNTHCSWSGMPLTASAPNALSPFLPTLIEALERQEHLHFSDECRSQLLSMSAATADGRLAFAAQRVGTASPPHVREHCSSNRSRSVRSRSGMRPNSA